MSLIRRISIRSGPIRSDRSPKGYLESHGGHATVWRGYVDSEVVEMRDLEKCALGKKLCHNARANFLQKREKIKDPKRGGNVAVKKLRVADDTDFERVLGLAIREAEFLAGVAHQNIVELEGFFEDVSEGTIWLVFPWADQGNLRDFIASDPWEMPEKVSLIEDVARGLAYLHSRNPPICHGDLKSLNVLVYTDGYEEAYAKITDFGSARRLSQDDPNINTQAESQAPTVHSPSVTFNTSTKTITLTANKYTLRWAAPELLLEDRLSLWSDIWASGWIAYEVMTESLPFEDVTSDVGIVERVVEGKLPSLADDADLELIRELCSLMEMCWKMQPTERPTADSCRMAIKEMPMLVPGMAKDRQFLTLWRLCTLGDIYKSRGQHEMAFDLLVGNFEDSSEYEEPSTICSTLSYLSQLARRVKKYSEAIAVYDVIWECSEEGLKWDDEYYEAFADALCNLAELHRLRNEDKEAIEPGGEGWKIREEKQIAAALCRIAQHRNVEERHLKERLVKATLLYTRALEISTNLGDKKGRAEALWGLAEVHRLQGEYEKAIPLYTEVLEIRTDLGDKEGRADALWDLAEIHRLRGDKEGRTDALRGLAEVHRLRHEYQKATPPHTEALEIHTGLGDEEGRADALWGFAKVHRLRGEYEKAIPLYTEALEIRTKLAHKKRRADALWGLAEVHRLQREYHDAITLFHEAQGISTNIGHRQGIVAALLGLANVYRDQNRWCDALSLYEQAAEVAEQIGNVLARAHALRAAANARRQLQLHEVPGHLMETLQTT